MSRAELGALGDSERKTRGRFVRLAKIKAD